SVQWVNNETGVIQPITAIGDAVSEFRHQLKQRDEPGRRTTLLLHVDATQALGKLPVDVKAAGVDLSIELSTTTEAIPVELRAGDVVVFHCHMLHRSEGNHSTTRDRRILFLRYADADAVEVYNNRRPRIGPLLRGVTRFSEVAAFEREFFQSDGR
ncbi:MAG: aminotransferase class V-fold PLP-dependent enzyme, partial [Pirellulales bacterium]|nr:aminotransferase class V-fold PLP-dependent enzyme [Pirellulales bacterium]